MLDAYLPHIVIRGAQARVTPLESMIAERGIMRDLLAIAAAIALAILAILFWSVGHFAGLALPVWYWALGYLGMTVATYAQLVQRRDQQEAPERDHR